MRRNKTSKPRLAAIYNNILYGTLLTVSVTGIFLYIMANVQRYAEIEIDVFTKAILSLVLVLLVLFVFYFIGFSIRVVAFRKIFFATGFILLILGSVATYYIVSANIYVDRMVNTDSFENVAYSVIGFSENDTEKEMDKGTLGFIEHDEEFDKIMQDAIRPHSRVVKYLEYKDYHSMLEASLKGEIQYALVPKDFSRLEESFEAMDAKEMPLKNAKALFTFNVKVEDDVVDVEVLEKPFSILLLGNNGGLSDSIIIATVNPKTLNVTMTSLARDSYLPIACYPNQTRDKLNHARARGRQCLIDTIETYMDVEMDFYFETDFYALQKIVDALGGLELESPVAFAGSLPYEEKPDEYQAISVPKGKSLMDGRQAITFARERAHMPRGDFDRQLNQQYVIKEVANAIIRERNPDKLVSVLKGASENIQTNLPVEAITKLLGYAIQQIDRSPLDAINTFRIESSQIMGTTPMINKMSVIVPFKNDVIATQNLIKSNLQEKPSLNNVRGFSFSMNEPYQTAFQKRSPWGDQAGGTIDIGSISPSFQKPTDKNPTAPTKPPVDVKIEVPNFTNPKTHLRKDLESWASANKIKLNITPIQLEGNKYVVDQVTHQDYAGQTINKGLIAEKGLNVSIVVKPDKVEEATFDYTQLTTHAELKSFLSKHDVVPKITQVETDDANLNGKIAAQPANGKYTKTELSKKEFKVYKLKEVKEPEVKPPTEEKPATNQ